MLFFNKKSLFLFVSSHFSVPSFLRLPLFSSSSSLHHCQFAARRLAAQPLAISSTHLANPQTHLFSLFTQIGIWVIGFFCVCLVDFCSDRNLIAMVFVVVAVLSGGYFFLDVGSS